MGEVLEGLKGRREGKKLIIEDKPVEVDNLEFFLNTLKDFVGGPAPISVPGEEDLNSWEYQEAAKPIIKQRQQLYINFVEIAQFLHPEATLGMYTEEELIAISAAELAINLTTYRIEDDERRRKMNDQMLEKYLISGRDTHNRSGTTGGMMDNYTLYKQYITSVENINDILEGVLIRKGKEIGLGNNKLIGSKSPHNFMRWDFITAISVYYGVMRREALMPASPN